MKFLFCFGGGKHDAEIRELVEYYRTRVGHYAEVDIALIGAKAKDENGIREEESAKMLAQLKPGDFSVLFDERGKEISSLQFAKVFEHSGEAHKRIVIIVGGAYGVNDELRTHASQTVAFSKMIFPHQLARTMALEQSYRALAILAGSKYHHG